MSLFFSLLILSVFPNAPISRHPSAGLCFRFQIKHRHAVQSYVREGIKGDLIIDKVHPRINVVIASNLKILPEPLNFVVSELCSGNGNGGGLGFRKGLGGGGGGGFDGWRRRKKRLGLALFGLVMVCGFAVLIGRELGSEYFWGVLGVSLFGFSIGGWKRGFKDWALGFCCCAVLMGLGLRNQEVKRWVEKSGVCSIMNVARRRRRKIKI